MTNNYKNVYLDKGENIIELRAENGLLLGTIYVQRIPRGQDGFINYHHERLETEFENGQGAVFKFESIEVVKRR